jgi:hypothetical protein
MNIVLLTMCLVLCVSNVYANPTKSRLSQEEKARITALKETFLEVEKKTPEQMISTIEKSPYPQINLAIKEAMARAYVDIVREQNVQGQKKKEWLYSMIALNMAYFQFGGDKDSAAGAKNLNKLIRAKLKTYLPVGIFKQRGFHADV